MTERRYSVLLVDDEPDFLETVSYWLTSQGYAVTLAKNGAEALDRVVRQKPDVVFLDIMMPRMDGLETLRQIRQSHATLPVVLLTTTEKSPNTLVDFQALGITGLFQKQDNLEAFSRILETALEAVKRG